MSFQVSKAIGFIRAGQNPDGGWGYEAGRMSLVEPTAFCLLALHANGEPSGTARGLEFLKSCQKESGAVGIDPKSPEGNWMAYAALLAFHDLGAVAEEERLKDWVLNFEDASGRFTKEEISIVASRYRYDASIPGWSWTPGTTAWIEPTALFILALRHAGVPASEKRIRSGVDLILDRRVPSGGWNYGNPYSKSIELEASMMPTALALAALGAAGVPEGRPAVAAGIQFLKRSMEQGFSTATSAWVSLALESYPSGAALRTTTRDRLAGLQKDDGGFRDNLFETALASLVLSGAPLLRRARAVGR